ncbi:hypothetical protein CXF74_21565 [Psychromonas sp. Urea-02u-13]|nr:hypothetical protein CXF74_21565 [Psychromonas sp. Urea-02u-13]
MFIDWLKEFSGMSGGAIFISIVGATWLLANNIYMLSLKSKSKLIENETSIRLNRLADKQLDVMLLLYEQFAELDGNLQYYSGPFDWNLLAKDPDFISLYHGICEFQKSFNKSKVFLPKSLENEFVTFINCSMKIKSVFRTITDPNFSLSDEDYLKDKSLDDMKHLATEIPKIKESIESKYRQILHVGL